MKYEQLTREEGELILEVLTRGQLLAQFAWDIHSNGVEFPDIRETAWKHGGEWMHDFDAARLAINKLRHLPPAWDPIYTG